MALMVERERGEKKKKSHRYMSLDDSLCCFTSLLVGMMAGKEAGGGVMEADEARGLS